MLVCALTTLPNITGKWSLRCFRFSPTSGWSLYYAQYCNSVLPKVPVPFQAEPWSLEQSNRHDRGDFFLFSCPHHDLCQVPKLCRCLVSRDERLRHAIPPIRKWHQKYNHFCITSLHPTAISTTVMLLVQSTTLKI